VDLRLPQGDPGRSLQAAAASGFLPNPSGLVADGKIDCDVGPDVYEAIIKQKSFAGWLMLAFGDSTSGEALANDAQLVELSKSENAAIPLCTCFWRRDMDYQPPPEGLDVGVCASGPANTDDGTIDMRETGASATYAEGWLRLAGTGDGPFCALELVEDTGVARKGFWVRAGNRFAYAIGRPSDEASSAALKCESGSHTISQQVGKSLAEALSDHESVALQQAWSYVAVIGQVMDDGSWYIESSSRPDLVGCTLLGGVSSTCCSFLSKGEEDGYINQVLIGTEQTRKWRIVEVTGFDLPGQE
jgi:hypothetical protein